MLQVTLANLTATQMQEGLRRLVEEGDVATQLNRFTDRAQFHRGARDAHAYIEMDLDGDGTMEYALALPVRREGSYLPGAALFVIHQQEGRYVVDLDPLAGDSSELMGPYLFTATDLTGEGRPQLVWYRPESIATGPQPYAVFVTSWEPGRFTHLPGAMVISNLELGLAGKVLHLSGSSRTSWMPWRRNDTYRFRDGAFHLVARSFEGERYWGYERFWDALVAEELGQLDEAEAAYRAVLEPGRRAHPGEYMRYNSPPVKPSAAELAEFDEALRAFARFRLGMMGRRVAGHSASGGEGVPGSGRYEGLLEAGSCDAATAWAEQHPEFLAALNRAIAHRPWTGADLCTSPPFADAIE